MYYILEVANTHGGDFNYLNSLLDEFEDVKGPKVGIKFQAFKYDEIATKDYEWYEIYEKLYFSPNQWKEVIKKANQRKDVWLDIFDAYGIEILCENFNQIHGIKLQSSVLENNNVFEKLKGMNLGEKTIIINIAGYSIEKIKELISKYENVLKPKELLIEIGFQSYPTELEDSGMSKINLIKKLFPNKIVFADHTDGTSDDAIELPFAASLSGVDYIEKHIMHSSLKTIYDFQSSISLTQFLKLKTKVDLYQNINKQDFINQREKDYLKKTIQIPVFSENQTKNNKIKYSDFNYKRTSKLGLDSATLNTMFASGYVKLNSDKAINDTLKTGDLSKVKIACIVAARLKSSRLKSKALLKIGKLSSIELCLKNCLKFENVDQVVLATSFLEQDRELVNHTYNKNVIFHKGDPDNVVKRYLDIIDDQKIDVFVRVTGDMPFVSNDIFQFLLKEHFKTRADYTAPTNAAVGTNVEIINTDALRKVRKHFPNAEYSEYMTWYFQNNPEYFQLNFVDLPEQWVRDYRLTLDYQEDLDMFIEIQNHFDVNNLEFSIDRLFDFLDSNKEVSTLNSHLTLKYKTDQTLIDKLNNKTKIK
jgi:N,N'-diacetyllegionaminate synthase